MQLNFSKDNNALLPAVIQDAGTQQVLMLGYMNQAAYEQTKKTKKVTFYSRSKQRLWVKGETSGCFLNVVSLHADCDQDAILVRAVPLGPICHKGTDTCWNEENKKNYGFLSKLEKVISDRKEHPKNNSYVSSLFEKGINSIAQKVGEEAVETIIEAKDNNKNLFLNESADLLFHLLVLLKAKDCTLEDVVKTLEKRHQ